MLRAPGVLPYRPKQTRFLFRLSYILWLESVFYFRPSPWCAVSARFLRARILAKIWRLLRDCTSFLYVGLNYFFSHHSSLFVCFTNRDVSVFWYPFLVYVYNQSVSIWKPILWTTPQVVVCNMRITIFSRVPSHSFVVLPILSPCSHNFSIHTLHKANFRFAFFLYEFHSILLLSTFHHVSQQLSQSRLFAPQRGWGSDFAWAQFCDFHVRSSRQLE